MQGVEEIRCKMGGPAVLDSALESRKGVCTPVCGPQPGQGREVGVTGC